MTAEHLRPRPNPIGRPYLKAKPDVASLLATVGSRIRDLRMARGLTQTTLGDATGLHHVTLSMYERGQREPSLDALITLARYFGVPMSDLVNEGDR